MQDRFTESLTTLVGKIWKDTDQLIGTIFEDSEMNPPEELTIRRRTERNGGSLVGKKLYLTKEAISGKIPLQGVIIREYVMSNLPEKINSTVQEMIGNSTAIYLLRGAKRELWYKSMDTSALEMKCCKPIGGLSHENWQFRCFLKILAEIVEAAKSEVTIGMNEYHRIVQETREKCVPYLNTIEIALLRRFLRTPPSPLKVIAKDMGKSIQWVSKKIRELEEIEVIRRYTTVNLHSIGIREFTIVTRANDRDLYVTAKEILNEFPYICRIEECAPDRGYLIASLQVPDTKTIIRAVKMLVESLSSVGMTQIHEPIAAGYSKSFKFYDVDSGKWKIPWDLAEIEFNRIYHESLAKLMPKIEYEMTPSSKYLTSLDLQVLQKVLEGIASITDIRQTLHVGQAKIATSYKSLRDEKIIVDANELLRVGLNEHVAIIAVDEEIAAAIVAWLQTLPKVEYRRWLDGGMKIRVDLPQGGTHGILEALNEVLPDINVAVIQSQTVRPFIIPIEEWDEDLQRWGNTNSRIEEWINTHQ